MTGKVFFLISSLSLPLVAAPLEDSEPLTLKVWTKKIQEFAQTYSALRAEISKIEKRLDFYNRSLKGKRSEAQQKEINRLVQRRQQAEE